jgi:hypothetical protein
MAKCLHEKERSRCRECNGGSFCAHNIIRGTCSLCEPEKVFTRYERQARERGLRFGLSLEQFKQIVFQPCFYCNEWGQPRGIDRKNNFEGYTPGNSRPCCARCNRYKSNESESVFLGHVRRIEQHQLKLRLKSEIDRGGIAGVASAHSPVFPLKRNDGVQSKALPGASPEVS